MTDEAQPTPAEFPKWVEVHPSHVAVNAHGHQTPQGFSDSSFDRVAKRFMVLVENPADEARAVASKDEPASSVGEPVSLEPAKTVTITEAEHD